MIDRKKVIKALEDAYVTDGVIKISIQVRDVLVALLKEQEAVEPTINEDGEAYCICGENVGIIPNSKNLPSIRSKYCSECGRRMKWE